MNQNEEHQKANKIITSVARKFFAGYKDQITGIDYEDVVQELWVYWMYRPKNEGEVAVRQYLSDRAKEYLNHNRNEARIQRKVKEGSVGEWSMNQSTKWNKKIEQKIYDRYDTFVALQTPEDQRLLRWAKERVAQVVMAERLGVTQPSVSNKLKQLKDKLKEFLGE